MSKRGGYRPGAGRPKGSVNKIQFDAKQELIEKVRRKWTPLIEAKMDLALGHWVEIVDKNGHKRVYRTKPSGDDINDLMQFVAGKPTQPIDLESEGLNDMGKGMQDIGAAIREILTKKQQ